jgi:hypothetical protein
MSHVCNVVNTILPNTADYITLLYIDVPSARCVSCLILDSYRCSFSFSLRMRASVLSLYFRYSASRSSLLGASAAAAVGGPLPSEVGGGRRFSGLFGGRRIFSGLFGARRIFSGLFGGGRRWTSEAGGSGGPLGRRLRGDRERDLKNVSGEWTPVLGIRIRMFLGLPDPDPLVRGTNLDPDPSLFS